MNNQKQNMQASKGKPKVRQTLTSLYRLARANPQLVRNNTIDSNEYRCKKLQLPSTVTSLTRRETIQKPIEIAPVVPTATKNSKPPTTFNTKNEKQQSSRRKWQVLEVAKPRRSLSAQTFERKKHVPMLEAEREMKNAEITQSLQDISLISPLKKKVVTFQSPALSNKQSISATPLRAQSTPYCNRNSDLHSRLEEWLKKRGKSSSAFRHLKCFDGPSRMTQEEDENKENIECPVRLEEGESYEALHIEPAKKAEEPRVLDASELKDGVTDALYELQKIIVEGYPHDQCEVLLASIRQHYPEIEEEYHYWECRAALERSRGNLSCAVECLTTAILKGAEVEYVDASLEQLLKKFSHLNIDTPTGNTQKSRSKGLTEVCNIFKSSLIQFAVREREQKKCKEKEESSKQYFATPVRRSTRKSRVSYIKTPRVQICTSLADLDDTILDDIAFKPNAYLK